MLIGIGTLIIAKHPALHSLAEVTIIGMFSVVLMAYLFPPLIFRWLVYNKGLERKRPITLRNLIWRDRNNTSKIRFIEDCYRYKGVDISSSVCHQLRKYTKKGTLEKIESSITSSIKTIIIINNGWGELSMLLALENPKIKCFGIEKDEEKYIVAKYTAENRVQLSI